MRDVEDLAARLPSASVPARVPSRARGWIAYAAAWSVATVLWAVAASTSGEGGTKMSPLQTLPYAALAMGTAALLGVGVWHLTGRVHWKSRDTSFYAIHAVALVAYLVLYPTSMVVPDIARGHFKTAFDGV